jgi:YgiT-type zinc finger domain-containing protein
VDDAVDADIQHHEKGNKLAPIVTAHRIIEIIENRDVNDQPFVWIPFHFFPGNEGKLSRVILMTPEGQAVWFWDFVDRKLQEKEVICMLRAYHKCRFCGGEVLEKRITVDYRWGEELIALIENVPTGVCQVCGEQYLKAEIVKEMEKLAHSKENPKKIIQVPLKELAVA